MATGHEGLLFAPWASALYGYCNLACTVRRVSA